MSVARLLLPAVRWSAEDGYRREWEAIERALDLGVGGFILFGGEADAVRDLTEELTRRAPHRAGAGGSGLDVVYSFRCRLCGLTHPFGLKTEVCHCHFETFGFPVSSDPMVRRCYAADPPDGVTHVPALSLLLPAENAKRD